MPPGPALTPRAAEAARALEAGADPDRAAALHLHFRTGPGGYGAGDVFLGLTMPAVRTVARAFAGLGPEDVAALLRAREHEKRMAALLVACRRDERAASERERFAWAGLYLAGRAGVDNWDLVDASAPTLLGGEILRGRGEAPVGPAHGRAGHVRDHQGR